MQMRRMLAAGILILIALSGCNSTDALVPQVDVGSVGSSPINQADLDAMSTPSQDVRVTSLQAPLPPAVAYQTGNSVSNPPVQSLAAPTPFADTAAGDYVDPPGTLEAQAGRLSAGRVPAVARQPEAQAQAETETETPRAAEEGASPARTPSAAAPQTAADTPSPATAALPPTAASGTIRFLPIIGAPVEAVTPLSRQLGTEARAGGLTIKSAADPTSEHILKGYFSALNDGGKTTVVYVWDVLDTAGNRLHRIQGQDTVGAGGGEPWATVPAATMQAIATRTIAQYLEWRQSIRG